MTRPERCRDCVDAISPHWNRCEEGKCIVADTFDATAQARQDDPFMATLKVMASLSEGDHGYNEHVATHWPIFLAALEAPADATPVFAQLPLFDTCTVSEAAEYEDIGL